MGVTRGNVGQRPALTYRKPRPAGRSAGPATAGGQPFKAPYGRGAPGASRGIGALACLLGLTLGPWLLAGCDQTESVQRGYRGVALTQLYDMNRVEAADALHQIPPPEPRDPPDPELPLAKDVHQNVQVLADLNVLDFSRLMQAMSTWVAPEQGCEYCHNTDNLASDEKYTKVVARRMLQMTWHINTNWKTHVAATGVTCWTCHRGQNVPSGIWFTDSGPNHTSLRGSVTVGNKAGQNTAGVRTNGYSSLPFDPLSTFLEADYSVSVQGSTPLQAGNRHSIKQAEWTYALMMYISNSLGVNCTYCHNTRAMGRWEESSPQRVTAWYGIRMVRDLNRDYLSPLKPVFPAYRLGPEGDGPKLACETCHKGAFKPLYGVSMLGDYPELAGSMPAPTAPAQSATEPAAGPPTDLQAGPAGEPAPGDPTPAL
jgi:photosynthetic reaction center cytochrome c subunit